PIPQLRSTGIPDGQPGFRHQPIKPGISRDHVCLAPEVLESCGNVGAHSAQWPTVTIPPFGKSGRSAGKPHWSVGASRRPPVSPIGILRIVRDAPGNLLSSALYVNILLTKGEP